MFLFGVRPVVLSSKLILLAGRLVPGHSLFESEHMALEGVTSLGAMTVKTKGCVITWGP